MKKSKPDCECWEKRHDPMNDEWYYECVVNHSFYNWKPYWFKHCPRCGKPAKEVE